MHDQHQYLINHYARKTHHIQSMAQDVFKPFTTLIQYTLHDQRHCILVYKTSLCFLLLPPIRRDVIILPLLSFLKTHTLHTPLYALSNYPLQPVYRPQISPPHTRDCTTASVSHHSTNVTVSILDCGSYTPNKQTKPPILASSSQQTVIANTP